ncbi:MAG: DNA-directed RNA polymerase subunit omega [Bacillota bacterium]
MIDKPSPKTLNNRVDSIYTLVVLAARRARQLSQGGEPLLKDYQGEKPVTISLEEIESGKITYRKNQPPG